MSIEMGTVGEWVSAASTTVLGVAAFYSSWVASRLARAAERMRHVQSVSVSYEVGPFDGMANVVVTNRTPFTIHNVFLTASTVDPKAKVFKREVGSLLPGRSTSVATDDDFEQARIRFTFARFTYLDGSVWETDNEFGARMLSERPRLRDKWRRGRSNL